MKQEIIEYVRVNKPKHFNLTDINPAETFGLTENKAKILLEENIKKLEKKQELLYAEGKWSVLAVFQAMDAAGKDGVIKHVMSGVNPQGCSVHSFKAPSSEELAHDFLWRAAVHLPERGRIGIFNRSHYEEVLVVRIHPEFLAKQNLPEIATTTDDIWEKRFKAIRNFEKHLSRSGTKVLKFHLRVSKEEQRKRFLTRLQDPGKRWKFSTTDISERAMWDEYMEVYESMIVNTSTKDAPWHVIPADNKWVAWLAVSTVLVDALHELDPKVPGISKDRLVEFKEFEKALLAEG